mgnify:CR=1 FL=1
MIKGALFSLGALVLFSQGLYAASKDVGFFDLNNTNTVVLIAFTLFIALLIYLRVPQLVAGALDTRIEVVDGQIQKAIAVKDESVELLAAIKRQQTKAREKAAKIISDARENSKHDLDQIEIQISNMISRKLSASEEQIKMVENAAVKKISHKSAEIAVKVAEKYLSESISDKNQRELVDTSISSLATDIENLNI